MHALIGIPVMIAITLIYVAIPLTAIWFIARGGHATRVITFIASIIVVAVIALGTGFNMHEHSARAAFYAQFERPFHELSEHLHSLLINGHTEQAIALSEQMVKLELRFSTKGSDTNTLRNFVYSIENK